MALLGVAAAVTAMVVVLYFPRYMVESRHLVLSAKEQLDAEASIRTSFLQIIGGGILVTGLYFTARGFQLTRVGHITDRYARAIEQIGNPNADVRIGGIYALERIATDSPEDRQTVIEVLTAFVREHTRSSQRTPSDENIGADAQAVLSVLARRPVERSADARPLDLRESGLNGADFRNGDFRKAWFYYCRLDGAIFTGAAIENAGLSFCKARGAPFNHCRGRGANFVHAEYKNGWFLAADLTDADFLGCDLSGSDFGRRYAEDGDPPQAPSILTGARFTKAVLAGTNLKGVDLTTVRGLTYEQLREAITDANTRLPRTWPRMRRRMITEA